MSNKILEMVLARVDELIGKSKIPIRIDMNSGMFLAQGFTVETPEGFPMQTLFDSLPVIPCGESFDVVCVGDQKTLCKPQQTVFYLDGFLASADPLKTIETVKEFVLLQDEDRQSLIDYQPEYFEPVLNIKNAGYDESKLSYAFDVTHVCAYTASHSCRLIGDMWKPRDYVKTDNDIILCSEMHSHANNFGVYQKTFTRSETFLDLFELSAIRQTAFGVMPSQL
jgi:hypothetical protein